MRLPFSPSSDSFHTYAFLRQAPLLLVQGVQWFVEKFLNIGVSVAMILVKLGVQWLVERFLNIGVSVAMILVKLVDLLLR